MKKGSILPSLLLGAAVFAVSLFGLYNLAGRPGIRREHLGRPVVGVDAHEIRRTSDIRFALTRKKVGDLVVLRFGPDGGPAVVRDTIVPFYSQAPFPLATVLLGCVGFLAGFGVLLLRPSDRRARIFTWLCVSFGASAVIVSSTAGVQGRAVNLLPGVLFNFAYPMTFALLLWFARSYAPHRRMSRPALFWVLPAAWGAFLGGSFLVSQLGPSIGAFRVRQQGLHAFRLYIVAMGAAAMVEFARALRTARSEEDRAHIKWYAIGLALGLGPFLVLHQLPFVFAERPLLPGDFAGAFFFMLPVFAASVLIQLRLLRTDVVFHRGLVYALLTVFTISAYIFVVDALRLIFPRATPAGNALILVGTAIAVAFLLSPGRTAIRETVDKLFFRQAYDYRAAARRFKAEAAAVVEAEALVALFAAAVSAVLPVAGVGVVLRGARGPGGMKDRVLGWDEAAASGLEELAAVGGGPWARPDKVRGSGGLDFSAAGRLEAAGAAVALAMPGAAGAPAGLLVFGPKASGHRFTNEDLDLVEALAADLAANLGRIRIQEEMIYERASRDKAEELVRLKTEFVAAVSHELRTPMTSLLGLAGLLRSGKVGDPARRDRLLGLMAGECGRLARFLNNVLDHGKIETGAKAYAFADVELGPLVREVVDIVREARPEREGVLRTEGCDGPAVVRADPDAVRQALVNVIDNAVKYGPDRGEVTVALVLGPGAAVVSVADRGMGIAPEERARIFEGFYRSPRAVERDPSGVGLGLKIVGHIMAAHGGRVEVESRPGEGSVFRLVFPLPGPRSSAGSG